MLRPTYVLLGILAALVSIPAAGSAIDVVAVTPVRNSIASVSSPITITFDRPVAPATITPASLRVFGRWSGAVSGSVALSNGNRTVTWTRSRPFTVGEMVFVNLSHAITGADLTPLRQAGFAWSFVTRAGQTTMTYEQIDVMSNRIANQQTRIYGTSAADLDEDGWLDLATINEVSADVRVFLNRADGTGLYDDFLTPQAIGIEASPNDTADFDNDGHADLVIAAVLSNRVYVLLGAGDGSFDSIVGIPVGTAPHGVAPLDVDGDGDWDIVNSNTGNNNLSLLLNNGAGVFSAPSFFEGGVNGEYGLAAADMNGDGIADVVVTGRDGQQIVTQLGNGTGGFTLAGTAQSSGGRTWVVAVGDLDADGILDAAVANSSSNNGAVLLGNGNGTFGAPDIATTGAHTVASDLGDLDGDGDLDWVLSSFGGGFWRLYVNDGNGDLTFDQDITAPSNPSCAVLLDFDNDGDLDLALSDEIADVVVLVRSNGSPTDATTLPGPGSVSGVANAPDPFGDETVVRFHLATPGDATIDVHDVAGRRVSTSHLTALRAGWNTYRFAARDDRGRRLPNGVYHCTVRSGGTSRTDRMVRLR